MIRMLIKLFLISIVTVMMVVIVYGHAEHGSESDEHDSESFEVDGNNFLHLSSGQFIPIDWKKFTPSSGTYTSLDEQWRAFVVSSVEEMGFENTDLLLLRSRKRISSDLSSELYLIKVKKSKVSVSYFSVSEGRTYRFNGVLYDYELYYSYVDSKEYVSVSKSDKSAGQKKQPGGVSGQAEPAEPGVMTFNPLDVGEDVNDPGTAVYTLCDSFRGFECQAHVNNSEQINEEIEKGNIVNDVRCGGKCCPGQSNIFCTKVTDVSLSPHTFEKINGAKEIIEKLIGLKDKETGLTYGDTAERAFSDELGIQGVMEQAEMYRRLAEMKVNYEGAVKLKEEKKIKTVVVERSVPRQEKERAEITEPEFVEPDWDNLMSSGQCEGFPGNFEMFNGDEKTIKCEGRKCCLLSHAAVKLDVMKNKKEFSDDPVVIYSGGRTLNGQMNAFLDYLGGGSASCAPDGLKGAQRIKSIRDEIRNFSFTNDLCYGSGCGTGSKGKQGRKNTVSTWINDKDIKDIVMNPDNYKSCPHTQGYAIDLVFLNKGKKAMDNDENSQNKLRRMMCDNGWVNFAGEYWHYVYGNKNWKKAKEAGLCYYPVNSNEFNKGAAGVDKYSISKNEWKINEEAFAAKKNYCSECMNDGSCSRNECKAIYEDGRRCVWTAGSGGAVSTVLNSIPGLFGGGNGQCTPQTTRRDELETEGAVEGNVLINSDKRLAKVYPGKLSFNTREITEYNRIDYTGENYGEGNYIFLQSDNQIISFKVDRSGNTVSLRNHGSARAGLNFNINVGTVKKEVSYVNLKLKEVDNGYLVSVSELKTSEVKSDEPEIKQGSEWIEIKENRYVDLSRKKLTDENFDPEETLFDGDYLYVGDSDFVYYLVSRSESKKGKTHEFELDKDYVLDGFFSDYNINFRFENTKYYLKVEPVTEEEPVAEQVFTPEMNKVSVMSWNVREGCGSEKITKEKWKKGRTGCRGKKAGEISEFLVIESPDIILLQEAEGVYTKLQNSLLDYNSKIKNGLAVFVRGEITSFSETDKNSVLAELNVKGKDFKVYNVRLDRPPFREGVYTTQDGKIISCVQQNTDIQREQDPRKNYDEYINQLNLLTGNLEFSDPDFHYLITGTFNTDIDLTSRYDSIGLMKAETGITFPIEEYCDFDPRYGRYNADERIDQIYYLTDPDVSIETKEYYIDDVGQLSDHYPVAITFDFA